MDMLVVKYLFPASRTGLCGPIGVEPIIVVVNNLTFEIIRQLIIE